jgi:hypothetical protein
MPSTLWCEQMICILLRTLNAQGDMVETEIGANLTVNGATANDIAHLARICEKHRLDLIIALPTSDRSCA